MKRPQQLSASFVRSVNWPGRYGDGRGGFGLSLLVKPTANGRLSKTWAQRLRNDDGPFNVGLGSYPVVSLAEARAKALENRRDVEQGRDPRGDVVAPTFAEAAEKVIALHAEGWRGGMESRSAAQWQASLRDYAHPTLGAKRIDKITTGDVLACLVKIWHDKPETARRVRQRIAAVLRWAVAEGHRFDDPTVALDAALPRHRDQRQHRRALPYSEVAGALAAVQASQAWPATKLAFEFLVLTAARSGEVRLAQWNEVDFAAATWTIPAERMKAGRAHRVPLPTRALEILAAASELSDASGLVFPSPTGRVLSDATLSKLLRENGVGAVPHGFRSSLRDWCSETGVPREVAEMCLAHTVRGVEGAYARSDLLDQRREVIQRWAVYLAN